MWVIGANGESMNIPAHWEDITAARGCLLQVEETPYSQPDPCISCEWERKCTGHGRRRDSWECMRRKGSYLHCIINSKSCSYGATWTIDVHANRLIRTLRLNNFQRKHWMNMKMASRRSSCAVTIEANPSSILTEVKDVYKVLIRTGPWRQMIRSQRSLE